MLTSTHIYTFIYTHIHARTPVCVYKCMCVYVYILTYIDMYEFVYTGMLAYLSPNEHSYAHAPGNRCAHPCQLIHTLTEGVHLKAASSSVYVVRA